MSKSRSPTMSPRLAFLHTSAVHVDTFDRLVRAAAPGLAVAHRVAEDLLADAQRLGVEDPALIARVYAAMRNAAADGATLVVCTCSTIGSLAEQTPTDGRFTAARIDRAMADRAVALGPTILVVAALESTLGPTTGLLRESARAARADVTLQPLLVSQAWPHFLHGDRDTYIQAVVQAVREHAAHADVIVLAQASMAPASEALADLGVPVLSSPQIGVQAILARLGA
jgi:hypothetical protein